MVSVRFGTNPTGRRDAVRLFISIEAQNSSDNGLAEILKITNKQLAPLLQKETEFSDCYGSEFASIAIIPTCVSDDVWEILQWKERKHIWRKKRQADIRLRMDYNRFLHESEDNKFLMFVDIIVKSIQIVIEQSKGDFDGVKLINDILFMLNVSQEQLLSIK